MLFAGLLKMPVFPVAGKEADPDGPHCTTPEPPSVQLKFAVTDKVVLSGTVNVPVNDEGFRADAVGTVAAEYYF